VRVFVLTIAALLLAQSQAFAGDAAAGRKKAAMCQTCHGIDGIAKQPLTPNLAGQVEPYLVKAFTEFKDGVRANEQMSIIAPNVSAEDIADISAWYASIKITVTVPQ
jgi:cytochrome c553